jgi:hypothetical protein
MSNSNQEVPSSPCQSDKTKTDLEVAKLLLDAWKFRQTHAWSLLTRYFFAAVFVSVIPYILEERLTSGLGYVLLFFPILGGMLALAAVWLYAAEYIRAQPLNHGFKNLLNDLGYPLKPTELYRWIKTILSPKIGWATVIILGVATISLSITNLALVWWLIRSDGLR